MKNKLYTLEEAKEILGKGQTAVVGAEEDLLSQLPPGNWIGGTIPYFMDEEGGTISKEKVFLNLLNAPIKINKIKTYEEDVLSTIFDDYPEWGVSFIILPGLSSCAYRYPFAVKESNDVFKSPIIGWASGVLWEKVGEKTPKVIDGNTGRFYDNQALVMHCDLPSNITPVLGIINIQEPEGSYLEFEEEITEVKEAVIDGEKQNVYDYFKSRGMDTDRPIITNVNGSLINTSILAYNDEAKTVTFATPVWPGYKYQISKPLSDYEEKFEKEYKAIEEQIHFNCNCLYNYFFGNLEGKKTGDVTGLITFGEVAYLMLNQTMVYLTLEEDE
ncbi:MAG: hypothetical protein GDA42_01840 [Ekhidna sp.]|nr:hypothetical protein [Ekhidna sp.]